jgi:hypothetical protein
LLIIFLILCVLGLCREVKEYRSSLTRCNKDDTTMEALAIAKYRQRHTGGVAKPLYAAKAAKPLW